MTERHNTASQKNTVFVTGGIGYIGSCTPIESDVVGFGLVIADNLVNANEASLARIEKITGRPLPFYKVDTRDENVLDEVFSRHHTGQVIHFVSLKAVGESVEKPLEYYENNIPGTLALLKACPLYIFPSPRDRSS